MSNKVKTHPLTIAIVGAGHRSIEYAAYALECPEKMNVVAVAEPNPQRREAFSKLHGIGPEMQFEDYDTLVAQPQVADAVINGTMDHLHYDSAIKLLRVGYDMLLEKPIAPTEKEVRELVTESQKLGRMVMVCHVLRYAPFYSSIKKVIDDGRIGEIVNIHSSESVSYHHMAVGYIRGKWNRREASTPILLAKCCHDLDLITWFMSGTAPTRVASFGSLFQFKSERAPEGSALRCLDGCKIEKRCPYSALLNFHAGRWQEDYIWETENDGIGMSEEKKLESLKTTNRQGRCVWHCDNNVVDHQNVIVEFANGATASHDLICGVARPTRKIHIFGTNGEIEGDMENGIFMVRTPSLNPQKEYEEEKIDVNIKGDTAAGHGGGDQRLAADFAATLLGESHSKGLTHIKDSLAGHLITFAAIEAMDKKSVIEICGA